MDTEEKIWQNAPNAEKTSRTRRKLGKWLANLTKKANERNSLSACTNAAVKLSGTS